MEHGVSDAESTLLDGGLGAESSFLDGDLDDSAKALLEGGLHPLRAEVWAVRGHRAGLVWHQPRQKRRPESELGHESLGTEAEVPGPKAAP